MPPRIYVDFLIFHTKQQRGGDTCMCRTELYLGDDQQPIGVDDDDIYAGGIVNGKYVQLERANGTVKLYISEAFDPYSKPRTRIIPGGETDVKIGNKRYPVSTVSDEEYLNRQQNGTSGLKTIFKSLI